MDLLPVTRQRRPRSAPPFVGAVLRGAGGFARAMADEAGVLVLAAVELVARLVWVVGAAAFVGGAGMSLVFWFNSMPADAWRATYGGGLALALMVAARFLVNACTRYRSRGADF